MSKNASQEMEKIKELLPLVEATKVQIKERIAYLTNSTNKSEYLHSHFHSKIHQFDDLDLKSQSNIFQERLKRLEESFENLKTYLKNETGDGLIVLDYLWQYTLELFFHDHFEKLNQLIELFDQLKTITNIQFLEILGLRFFIALRKSEGNAWIEPKKNSTNSENVNSINPPNDKVLLDTFRTSQYLNDPLSQFSEWFSQYLNEEQLEIQNNDLILLNLMLLLHQNKIQEADQIIRSKQSEYKRDILFLILRGDALKLLDQESKAIKSYSRSMTLAKRENSLLQVQSLIGKGFKPGSWEWKQHFMNCIQFFIPKIWPFGDNFVKTFMENNINLSEKLWSIFRTIFEVDIQRVQYTKPNTPSPNSRVSTPVLTPSPRHSFERSYDRPWTRDWKPNRSTKKNIINYSIDFENVERKYERPWTQNNYEILAQRRQNFRKSNDINSRPSTAESSPKSFGERSPKGKLNKFQEKHKISPMISHSTIQQKIQLKTFNQQLDKNKMLIKENERNKSSSKGTELDLKKNSKTTFNSGGLLSHDIHSSRNQSKKNFLNPDQLTQIKDQISEIKINPIDSSKNFITNKKQEPIINNRNSSKPQLFHKRTKNFQSIDKYTASINNGQSTNSQPGYSLPKLNRQRNSVYAKIQKSNLPEGVSSFNNEISRNIKTAPSMKRPLPESKNLEKNDQGSIIKLSDSKINQISNLSKRKVFVEPKEETYFSHKKTRILLDNHTLEKTRKCNSKKSLKSDQIKQINSSKNILKSSNPSKNQSNLCDELDRDLKNEKKDTNVFFDSDSKDIFTPSVVNIDSSLTFIEKKLSNEKENNSLHRIHKSKKRDKSRSRSKKKSVKKKKVLHSHSKDEIDKKTIDVRFQNENYLIFENSENIEMNEEYVEDQDSFLNIYSNNLDINNSIDSIKEFDESNSAHEIIDNFSTQNQIQNNLNYEPISIDDKESVENVNIDASNNDKKNEFQFNLEKINFSSKQKPKPIGPRMIRVEEF